MVAQLVVRSTAITMKRRNGTMSIDSTLTHQILLINCCQHFRILVVTNFILLYQTYILIKSSRDSVNCFYYNCYDRANNIQLQFTQNQVQAQITYIYSVSVSSTIVMSICSIPIKEFINLLYS